MSLSASVLFINWSKNYLMEVGAVEVNRDDGSEAAVRVNAAGCPCRVSCCRVGISQEGEVTLHVYAHSESINH